MIFMNLSLLVFLLTLRSITINFVTCDESGNQNKLQKVSDTLLPPMDLAKNNIDRHAAILNRLPSMLEKEYTIDPQQKNNNNQAQQQDKDAVALDALESMWSEVRHQLSILVPSASNSAKGEATATTIGIATVQKEKVSEEEMEKIPTQMAPIEKSLVLLRPKENERWVLKEEGIITWAVSSFLQPKASTIYMNCNLYHKDKMILSVFKGVPLYMGKESWTPLVFLEPSPNYKLRLWSQPSPLGIIDEYSSYFSIVPRPDDAFMFSYENSALLDQHDVIMAASSAALAGTTLTDLVETNHTIPKASLLPNIKIKAGQIGLTLLGASETASTAASASHGSTTVVDPNIPTGIYALYPSVAAKTLSNINTLCILLTTTLLHVVFFTIL